MSGRRNEHAFTLLELLVSLAIVAILLSLLAVRSTRASVDNTRCLGNLRQLQHCANILKNSEGGLLPFASYLPM